MSYCAHTADVTCSYCRTRFNADNIFQDCATLNHPNIQAHSNHQIPIGKIEFDESQSRVGRIPHKCPVCNGNGVVDVYSFGGRQRHEIACKPCRGEGVLWG